MIHLSAPRTRPMPVANRLARIAQARERQFDQTAEHKQATLSATSPASNRWPCSRRTAQLAHHPEGLKPPKLRGQSGTAIPAFQLVTKPPTKIKQKTPKTTAREAQIKDRTFKIKIVVETPFTGGKGWGASPPISRPSGLEESLFRRGSGMLHLA
jgi:hypothetical protein